MKKILVILFLITIIEGGFIIHLYKKPQIIIKAVYENSIEDDFGVLPILPKESLKRAN